MFRSYEQHDAHEFLNYVLNEINDELLKASSGDDLASKTKLASSGSSEAVTEASKTDAKANSEAKSDANDSGASQEPEKDAVSRSDGPEESESEEGKRSLVRDLFEGQVRNETHCLCCESVTNRGTPQPALEY